MKRGQSRAFVTKERSLPKSFAHPQDIQTSKASSYPNSRKNLSNHQPNRISPFSEPQELLLNKHRTTAICSPSPSLRCTRPASVPWSLTFLFIQEFMLPQVPQQKEIGKENWEILVQNLLKKRGKVKRPRVAGCRQNKRTDDELSCFFCP